MSGTNNETSPEDERITEAKKELAAARSERSFVDFITHRLRLHLQENNFAERLMMQLRDSRK